MRVALRVDVAHRAVHLGGGHVEDGDRARAVEVAQLAGLDLRVARAEHERRQPTDLQLEPDVQQQIGLVQDQHQARLGLDEVRVLVALAERFDLDTVAADFLGERAERGDRGHHPQRGSGGARRAERQRGEQDEASHGHLSTLPGSAIFRRRALRVRPWRSPAAGRRRRRRPEPRAQGLRPAPKAPMRRARPRRTRARARTR